MFVNFNILNQLGSPAINSNVFANRPAAGQTGRLFVSTDTFEIYRDNGTTWDLIGGPGSSTITGTGTATQVAYFTSSQAIGSSANLFWDNTNSFLGVATATPTATIEAVKTDGIGIYANFTTNVGTGSNAFGLLAKNVTNSSGYAAVIEETTPNTTAGQYPLLVKHSLSTGTAGVGMGTGIHFQLPDDAGTFKTTQLTIETIDAAAATYATRYRFMVQSAGSSTPAAYLNATGLGLGTATPGAKLDIHSTGTVAQFNTTSGTGNVFIALQRTGTGLWRIGDTYNSGANFFELHNTVLTNNAIEVLAASNEATFLSTKTYSTGNAIGIAVQHNLTIPNGVNVGLAAIGGVNSQLNLTLGGSTTVANTGRQGLEGSSVISFTGAGTLTMTQGSTVRAFSALSSVYAFNGSAVGTITHLAGLRICFPDNVGSAVNITNNYALLINNQTTGTGTVTYTNRWGIYQEGASDLNYFAANVLIGTTVNSGYKLDVNGNITGKSYRVNGTNGVAGYLVQQGDWLGTAATNLTLAAETGNGISFFTNGSATLGMFLNSANNLGLAVAPSAWGTSNNANALQMNAGSLFSFSTTQIHIEQNSYFNSGFFYVNNGFATAYRQVSGAHSWHIAPSGTAGNAITFTQAMTLDASGNLLLSTTAPVGSRNELRLGGNAAGSAITLGRSGNNKSLIQVDSSDFLYFENTANTDTLFSTNNTERLRIKAGGNVLIGTTTDTGQKLQVNGSGYFSTSLTALNTSTFRATGNGYTDGSIILQNSGGTLNSYLTNAGGGFYLSNDGSTQHFFVSSTGNAEIGGSVKTGAPNTGTAAAWKLGSRVAATVVVNTTEYIEVDIGGTLYKLATVT